MARPFDLRKEIKLAATPEQAWDADRHSPRAGWMAGRPGAHTRSIHMAAWDPARRVVVQLRRREDSVGRKLPPNCLQAAWTSPTDPRKYFVNGEQQIKPYSSARRERALPEPHVLMEGIAFGEQPRWHGGRLWFSGGGPPKVIAAPRTGPPTRPRIQADDRGARHRRGTPVSVATREIGGRLTVGRILVTAITASRAPS
jgi:hypothetical protein